MLASVLGVHRAFSWVVILGNAAAGLWALAAGRWRRLRGRALWWFTAAVEVAVAVEVALGVWLTSRQGIDAPRFHTFYGFVALITVGIIYSYRGQLRQRMYLLYGLGGLFLMGLAIRAAVLS